MGGGKKNENENENGRKREFATDPRSKRAREKNTPFGHAPHSDEHIASVRASLSGGPPGSKTRHSIYVKLSKRIYKFIWK